MKQFSLKHCNQKFIDNPIIDKLPISEKAQLQIAIDFQTARNVNARIASLDIPRPKHFKNNHKKMQKFLDRSNKKTTFNP